MISFEVAKNYGANLLGEVKPKILGVEVFGSVARKGSGNDLDLIVLATDDLVDEWIGAVLHLMREDPEEFCYSAAAARTRAFRLVFQNTYQAQRKAGSYLCDRDLDVFVFPRDWRCRIESLQQMLPHEDPEFMANIARDARPI